MSEKELKSQLELLQKENEELKTKCCQLYEQVVQLTEQVEEFKLQKDIAQAIHIANSRNV